jgi:hypothetical protein
MNGDYFIILIKSYPAKPLNSEYHCLSSDSLEVDGRSERDYTDLGKCGGILGPLGNLPPGFTLRENISKAAFYGN